MTKLYAPPGCSIRPVDLPPSIGAVVKMCHDGHAIIFLNARLSLEKQRDCLKHELRHLLHDDFYNNDTIMHIEREAGEKRSIYRRGSLPPLLHASDLPRPGRRHDKAELLIRQERRDDWKHDWFLKMDDGEYW